MQGGTKDIAVVLGGETAMIEAGFGWYEGGELIEHKPGGELFKLKLKGSFLKK